MLGFASAKTSHWPELLRLIGDLKKRYERLLIILKKKETLIIDGRERKLALLVKEEENLINEIEKLEVKRAKAAEACMPEGAVGPANLKTLLDIAPEDMRPKLEIAAVELLETMNAVAAMNRGVAELVREAMNFVSYQINLMSSDTAQETVYSGDGRMKDKPAKIRGIINREA